MKTIIAKSTAFFLSSLILSFTLVSTLHAATVTQTIETLNIESEADFLEGEKDTAILILHGFLTTNKFHTVVSMAKALNDDGYSVISPTLSLNINKRQTSVKCNSIHTHTLENDVLEIKDWIDWLSEKGYKKVILVGHSSGSLELLEYLNTFQDDRIQSVIFTSIFYLNGEELGTVENEVAHAKALLNSPQKRPHKYNFLFCKNNYFASPESYLSYLKLTRDYVLESIKNLKIPTHSIMGSADKRYQSVGENWLEELKSTGTNLITIEGANHFFSSEHEFDLQDHLVHIVNSSPQ